MSGRLAALLSGLVFGLGLTISQMINPAKVLAFFDLAGAWDPSLALVMASALLVAFIGYRIVLPRQKPLFDAGFHMPTRRDIDRRLMSGAALFGIGWGLTGYCPAPAIAALSLGSTKTFVFVVSMIVGMLVYRSAGDRLLQSPDTTTKSKTSGDT